MSENDTTKKDIDYADLLPALDVKDGLGRLMNNKKIYFKLLKSFVDQKMVDGLVVSMNSDDFSKIAQEAHALKGVTANLGLKELNKSAVDIEAKAKSGTKTSELIPSLKEADKEASQSIDTLLESEGVT